MTETRTRWMYCGTKHKYRFYLNNHRVGHVVGVVPSYNPLSIPTYWVAYPRYGGEVKSFRLRREAFDYLKQEAGNGTG